jgi:hypothetical protein
MMIFGLLSVALLVFVYRYHIWPRIRQHVSYTKQTPECEQSKNSPKGGQLKSAVKEERPYGGKFDTRLT